MRMRIYSCLLAAVLLLSLVLSACTGKEPGVDRESTKESAAESTKEGKTDEGSKGADETGNSTESGDSGKPAQSDAAGIASALSEMKAGDGFTMGSYEQDGKDKNGAEPLTWTVIAQEPGKALVLSDYVIERMPLIETEEDYATCIWPDSTLRTWLNGEFLNGAFTDEEKALILPVENVTSYMEDYQLQETTSTDSVFLLSCEEYGRYAMSLGTVGYGIPTPYVVEKYDPYLADVEGVDGITQAMSWWLRTSSDQGPINAASVYGADKTYSLYGDEVSYGRGVRPAMWLVWDKDFMEAYEKGDREPQKDEALEQKIAGAKPGSSLTFGKYDVDPRVGNGYEDLTWTVIDETDSALLIINDQVYFSMKFMDMTEDEAEELSEINWEMSDIRKIGRAHV